MCATNAICASGAKADSRIPYLLITFIYVLVAGVLRYWGKDMAFNLVVYSLDCPSEVCYGVAVVYRLMFALFAFFGTLTIVAALPCCRDKINEGPFFVKLLLLVGYTIVSFLIPPEFFDGVYYIWIVIAGLFQVIQIILNVDFAYRLHEYLMEKDMRKVILCLALFLYLSSLGAFIAIYLGHASEPDCGPETAFCVVTLVFTLIFTIISVMDWCAHGAVTPSAVVTIYCYWLLFSAFSENTRHCNTVRAADGGSTFEVVFGLCVVAFTVAYAGFKISRRTGAGAFSTSGPRSDKTLQVNERGVPEAAAAEEEEGTNTVSAFSFHLTMFSCSAYAAMLMSEWGLSISVDDDPEEMRGVVYIQMTSQWIAILLYTWSLVAPYVLTDREF